MARLDFSSKFSGLAAIKNTFAGILEGVRRVFGRKRIENIVLANTKARFDPKGRNRFAQFDPDKKPWAQNTEYTIARRKSNKRTNQALVDTGALRDAIVIVRSNLRSALTVGKGSAVVGIPRTSVQYDKGFKMQNGYIKRIPGRDPIPIPARPFIGIGPLEVSAVGRFIDRVFARVL